MFVCPKCESKKTIICPTCDGDGHRYFVPLLDFWEADCAQCYGNGYIKCPDCEADSELLQIIPPFIIQAPKDANPRCE